MGSWIPRLGATACHLRAAACLKHPLFEFSISTFPVLSLGRHDPCFAMLAYYRRRACSCRGSGGTSAVLLCLRPQGCQGFGQFRARRISKPKVSSVLERSQQLSNFLVWPCCRRPVPTSWKLPHGAFCSESRRPVTRRCKLPCGL